MLRVVEDGKPVLHHARGGRQANKQTPIFSNEMQEIVFSPYWNMPNSIKTEEIRPYIREEGGWFGGGGWNTAVLERHNLRINVGGREVDPSRIDWNRIDIRTLNIYQPPGPGNVLGNVKFLFPNKHDVYMHDTPQKSLFAQAGARREPWLHAGAEPRPARADPAQAGPRLVRRRGSPRRWPTATTSIFRCGRKIPVYITYFTLWLNNDGSISTFGDLYGHDSRIAAALRL